VIIFQHYSISSSEKWKKLPLSTSFPLLSDSPRRPERNEQGYLMMVLNNYSLIEGAKTGQGHESRMALRL